MLDWEYKQILSLPMLTVAAATALSVNHQPHDFPKTIVLFLKSILSLLLIRYVFAVPNMMVSR